MPVNVFGGTGNEIEFDVDVNGFKIINCGDPTDSQDVATKSYVDSRRAGTSWETNGNTLTVPGVLGSLNDQDVSIIRNNKKIIECRPTSIQLNSSAHLRVTADDEIIEDPDATALYFGCSALQSTNSFHVLFGSHRNKIYWRNTAGRPIAVDTINGLQINKNSVPIAYFGSTSSTGITQIQILEPILMFDNAISGLADPIENQDAATKIYVDKKVLKLVILWLEI